MFLSASQTFEALIRKEPLLAGSGRPASEMQTSNQDFDVDDYEDYDYDDDEEEEEQER